MDPGQAVMSIMALTATGVGGYAVVSLVQVVVKRLGGGSARPSAELQEELADLRARIEEGEQSRYRIAELEERLDFAERMLSQQRETGSLPSGGEGR